jgi:hypothetical protein
VSWTDPTFCVKADVKSDVQWVCSGVNPVVRERDDLDGYDEMPECSLGRGWLGRGPRTGHQAHNLPSPLGIECDLSVVWNQGWPVWRKQVPLQRLTASVGKAFLGIRGFVQMPVCGLPYPITTPKPVVDS